MFNNIFPKIVSFVR